MATRTRCCLLSIVGGAVLAGLALPVSGAEGTAKDVLKAAGIDAGLCVHLGCGREKTAALTADLAAESHLLVHGLALDAASLQRARKAIDDKGLNGRATVEKVPVNPLPYLPDLANVVVIEDFAALADRGLTMEEVNRVAAPGGAICVLKDGRWTKTVKPRPREMDDWTHPAHRPDASTWLPCVHRVASLLKRWLMGTHQGAVRPEHLDYYLDEFTFRFNRRTSASRGKLFYRLMQQAVQTEPVPYKDLIKHISPGHNHKQ